MFASIILINISSDSFGKIKNKDIFEYYISKKYTMEKDSLEHQEYLKEMMKYAVDLYVYQDKNSYEVITALKEKGVTEDQAKAMISIIDERVEETENSAHKKNVIIGGLFFAGGLMATFANLGFVFWGAIVFGGIQMVRGIMKV
jgi:hypothetical protein